MLAPGQLQIHSSLMCGNLSLTPDLASHALNLFLLTVTFADITIMVHITPYHANSTEEEMEG